MVNPSGPIRQVRLIQSRAARQAQITSKPEVFELAKCLEGLAQAFGDYLEKDQNQSRGNQTPTPEAITLAHSNWPRNRSGNIDSPMDNRGIELSDRPRYERALTDAATPRDRKESP